jgi:hypothetical protein
MNNWKYELDWNITCLQDEDQVYLDYSMREKLQSKKTK